MKQVAFLVLVLAAISFAQIPPYSDHSYTGPINHGIYGPYGPYGYGRSGVYDRIGTYGLVGTFAQGVNPSILHIGNSFFSKIQRRVESAYLTPAQIPKANQILSEAVNNFKNCEVEYLITSSIPTYKRCLQAYVNKASAEVSFLEGDNQPVNFYNRILYPQSNSKTLDVVETREPANMNSIKTSMEIDD